MRISRHFCLARVSNSILFLSIYLNSPLSYFSHPLLQLPENCRNPQGDGKEQQEHIRHVLVTAHEGLERSSESVSKEQCVFGRSSVHLATQRQLRDTGIAQTWQQMYTAAERVRRKARRSCQEHQ